MNRDIKEAKTLFDNLGKEVYYLQTLLESLDFDNLDRFTDQKIAQKVSSKLIKIKRLAKNLNSKVIKQFPEAAKLVKILKSIDPNILKE